MKQYCVNKYYDWCEEFAMKKKVDGNFVFEL